MFLEANNWPTLPLLLVLPSSDSVDAVPPLARRASDDSSRILSDATVPTDDVAMATTTPTKLSHYTHAVQGVVELPEDTDVAEWLTHTVNARVSIEYRSTTEPVGQRNEIWFSCWLIILKSIKLDH